MNDSTPEQDFISIVGAPRSGTFLLATMMEKALKIAIPFETHFIPLFYQYRRLWGDLSREHNRRRLLKSIFAFLEIWTPRAGRERDLNVLHQYTLNSIRDRLDEIARTTHSYQSIIQELFRRYAQDHHQTHWADKSALYHPLPPAVLDKCVPNLRIIHIIRDGRDVSLSWRGIWCGPYTLAESARLWRQHVLENRRWGAAHPDRYLEIRYEELVTTPDEIIKQLRDFLNIPVVDTNLDSVSPLAEALAPGTTHSKLLEPPDPSGINRWQDQMSDDDKHHFELIAGKTLAACGYETNPAQRRNTALKSHWRIAWSFVPPLLALRYWRLRLKNILPAIFLLAGPLRPMLVRFINLRIRV